MNAQHIQLNVPLSFKQVIGIVKQLSPKEKQQLGEVIWTEQSIADIEVPEEYKQIVRQRLKRMDEHPESTMTWEDSMNFKLIYAAEVFNDLQQNIDWYNEKQTGLGVRFYKAVKEQISLIKKNPYSIAVRYEDVRCVKVKGFPYMVHFKVFPNINTIKVTAIFSTYRNPKIWQERIQS
jgi:hypothetical protein